jgi:tetratricopeptide (TPR) repeat protein
VADAEPLARVAFEGLERLVGVQHRFSASSLFNYARALALQGRYDEAKVLYAARLDKIAQLPKGDASRTWYDFARLAASAGRKDDAIEHLEQALAAGYEDVEALRREDDLKVLRGDPRFAALIDRAQGGVPPAPP